MKKYVIIGILFSISIIFNIYFLCGKGITINNYTTNHQEQYQQQWQGMLSVNQWVAQGNTIEWKEVLIDGSKGEKLIDTLNKLHPISALYSKMYCTTDFCLLVYPDIFTKTKEIQK